MSRPRDWHTMSWDQQRDWQRQDNARQEAEDEADRQRRDREEAESRADDARRQMRAEREDFHNQLDVAAAEELEARREAGQMRRLAEELVAALEGFLHADPDVFRAELEAARAAIAKAEALSIKTAPK